MGMAKITVTSEIELPAVSMIGVDRMFHNTTAPRLASVPNRP